MMRMPLASRSVESIFDIGAQRPKCRSHAGMTLLHDRVAQRMLTMRTYIEQTLPIFDFAANQHGDSEYGQNQDLKARISNYTCRALNSKP